MLLDRLIPELQGRDMARTDGGLVLLRQPKGCLLVLTAQEYAAGIGRGKAILRTRRHFARLQAEKEKDR